MFVSAVVDDSIVGKILEASKAALDE